MQQGATKVFCLVNGFSILVLLDVRLPDCIQSNSFLQNQVTTVTDPGVFQKQLDHLCIKYKTSTLQGTAFHPQRAPAFAVITNLTPGGHLPV